MGGVTTEKGACPYSKVKLKEDLKQRLNVMTDGAVYISPAPECSIAQNPITE